jgi:hypothetical protein
MYVHCYILARQQLRAADCGVQCPYCVVIRRIHCPIHVPISSLRDVMADMAAALVCIIVWHIYVYICRYEYT